MASLLPWIAANCFPCVSSKAWYLRLRLPSAPSPSWAQLELCLVPSASAFSAQTRHCFAKVSVRFCIAALAPLLSWLSAWVEVVLALFKLLFLKLPAKAAWVPLSIRQTRDMHLLPLWSPSVLLSLKDYSHSPSGCGLQPLWLTLCFADVPATVLRLMALALWCFLFISSHCFSIMSLFLMCFYIFLLKLEFCALLEKDI